LGVSADSATDASAVGGYGNYQPNKTLVLHWDGSQWTQIASPNPGGRGNNTLWGVSVDSSTDAWAVGNFSNPNTGGVKTLALHGNGSTWTRARSPNPTDFNYLYGVSAKSASDAWAVGYTDNGTTGAIETLVLHWNGTAWSKVNSPNPGGTSPPGGNLLSGVSADSPSDAWAAGTYNTPTSGKLTLVLHWDGTSWSNA
jgi:hypothetical protein